MDYLQKLFVLILFVGVFISCALENDEDILAENSPPQEEIKPLLSNGDGDLLSDKEEVLLGSSKDIADIPKIIFTETQSEMSYSFAKDHLQTAIMKGIQVSDRNTSSQFGSHLTNKIAERAYKKINNIKLTLDDEISILDEGVFKSSSWNDQEYFTTRETIYSHDGIVAKSGHLMSNIKISLDDFKGVKKIENIKVGSYFLDYKNRRLKRIAVNKLLKNYDDPEIFDFEVDNTSRRPYRSYVFSQKELSPQLIKTEMLKRNDVGLAVIDYDITTHSGVKIKYSELRERILKNNARIIINTPNIQKILYIANKQSLADVLRSVFGKIELNKEGEYVSIGGKRNGISLPLDWNHLQNQELDKYMWYLDAPTSNLNKTLEKRTTYILSYIKVLDIAQTVRNNFKLLDSEVIWNTVSTDTSAPEQDGYKKFNYNLKKGDEVTLFIKDVYDEIPSIDAYTRKVKSWIYSCPTGCRNPEKEGIYSEYYCTANYKKLIFSEKTIDFASRLNDLKISFVIDGKQYSFSDLTVNSIVPVKRGVYIHFYILDDLDVKFGEFSLALEKFPEILKSEIGFIEYSEMRRRDYPRAKSKFYPVRGKCSNPSWHVMLVPNTDEHSVARQNITTSTTRKYQVSLSVKGVKR